MKPTLRRQLRTLQAYAAGSSVALVFLAGDHRRHDAVDDRVQVHQLALDGLAVLFDLFDGRVPADDVLDADHEARAAGDRRAVGQPSRAAAHRLDEEVRAIAGGVLDEIADLGGLATVLERLTLKA